MSLMTKVRVKLGSAEAEVEAEPEHLREAIDLVPELASKLTGYDSKVPDVAQAHPQDFSRDTSTPPSSSSVPMVAIDKGDSLSDVIGKFFSDPWGRERRKLSDVREALQSYGLNYPKQSVAVALLRLAKTTKIRRFKAEDGEFVYTSANLAGPRQQPREESLDGLSPLANQTN